MRTKGNTANESAAILGKVRETLASDPGIKVILMFGSVVSGKMSSKSDADVAVLFDQPLDSTRKMSILDRLEKILTRPVDLIDLFGLNGTILKQVLCGGRLLLNNSPRDWESLVRRMIYDQTDMMPYVRRTMMERQKRFIDG